MTLKSALKDGPAALYVDESGGREERTLTVYAVQDGEDGPSVRRFRTTYTALSGTPATGGKWWWMAGEGESEEIEAVPSEIRRSDEWTAAAQPVDATDEDGIDTAGKALDVLHGRDPIEAAEDGQEPPFTEGHALADKIRPPGKSREAPEDGPPEIPSTRDLLERSGAL